MDIYTQALAKALSGLALRIETVEFEAKGYHACLMVDDCADMPQVAKILLDQEYFIGFVTACHTEPDVQVLYQFARHDANFRIMVQCGAAQDNSVPTISHIFHGADWHERETRDFFGLTFQDHPNMAPFILDESDKDLKPLLKNEKVLKTVAVIFPEEGNES